MYGSSLFLIDFYGQVIVSGRNTNAELGFMPKKTITDFTNQLDLENIVHIATGKNFSVALDKFGKVFVCGLNDKYQLGLNHTDNQEEFLEHPILKEIIDVQCTDTGCIALDSNGSMWQWGNIFGEEHTAPEQLT